jgi:aryl-alcohol dehydrogenase-like predicted oxidoreductase
LLKPLEDIAAAKKATPAQVALAWLLARGDEIVPIPGTKRRNYLEENCEAAELKLSTDEIAKLDAAFARDVAAGTRYPEKQLKGLGI